jgi:outer membrane protein assembly factor BamB
MRPTRGIHAISTAASVALLLILSTVASSSVYADDNEVKKDILYVGDEDNDQLQAFDAATGDFKETLAPATAGILGPRGLISVMNNLLLANQNELQPIRGELLLFSDDNGALLTKVVPASNPNAPNAPSGVILWNNRLFVGDVVGDPADLTGATPGSLREYTRGGKFIAAFQPPAELLPPGLDPAFFHPRGVVVGPDGLLYVSTAPNLRGADGGVWRFDPKTGTFIDLFIKNVDGAGLDCTKNLNRPEGLTFGPDGRLYVTTFRVSGSDKVRQDTDAILVFAGPDSKHPGACVDQIDLDSPGALNGARAFAQSVVFGPEGRLFIPIQGNGPMSGAIRRYDVERHRFISPDFVAAGFTPPVIPDNGGLMLPYYITFGKTDPGTLAYDDEEELEAENK